MFRRAKHWLWLILCWFMLAGHVWAMPCDVDDDGDIDRDDLNLIQQAILARAPVSGPNDPRDPDSNSRIDSIDGRLCALRCTRARCGTINQPPFANAGPDQSVRVGGLVALSGAASSDPDGDPLRYLWTLSNRPLGSLASLIDAATVAPHFIADKPGQYLIQLIVNDGKADSAADTVTVSTENSRPIANAGPDQSVRVGTLVSLNGGGSSDVDGDPLRYTWQLGRVPPGSGAMLSNPDGVSPTLLIDRPGNYLIALTVSDATLSSLPDTVAVSTENSPPVANAGANQTIPLGGSIALDGSRSSDVDGDPLTFRWSLLARPAGSQAVLSDATAVSPRFIADYPGTYVAQLIVNDGSVDSAPASVSLSTANAAPVANAGPDQTVLLGSLVSLDGSASHDPEGALVIYNWSLTGKPVGSHATLNDSNSLNPGFSADLPGDYIVQLIVNDGALASAPDTVTISTANSRPVADAGPPQNVAAGTSVRLDGRASHDVDGDLLSFAWSLTAVPAGSGAMLSAATTANPGFTPDIAGTYVAQLIVRDGRLDSLPVTVVITVSAANRKPLAVVQAIPTSAPVGSTVLLKGTDSSDPDGDPLTWAWSIVFRPGGSLATIVSPSASQTSFVPDVVGSYTIQLLVNDGKVDSAPTLLVVQALPGNHPPQITSAAVTSATAGKAYRYDVEATDPDAGDVLSWSLVTSPTGMRIDPVSGLIEWTPGDGQAGSQPVAVRVVDQGGLSAVQDFTIVVGPPNHPPVITGAGISPQWTQLTPTETPPVPRYAGALHSYDEVNDRLIAFAGQETSTVQGNDVWVLSHASGLAGTSAWTKLEPTGTAPSPRSHFASAYDATANRLIVYGGCSGICSPLSDAWVLTNANGLGGQPEWLPLPASNALAYPVGGYDPTSNRLVVFGGSTGARGSDTTDVKVLLDGNGIGDPRWLDLSPQGARPPARGHSQPAVYDRLSNTLIVFGGQSTLAASANYNDVWVLSHANGLGGVPTWSQLNPTGLAPIQRQHHTMAYDPNSNRLMVFGGYDGVLDSRLSDTWVLTHANGQGGTSEWIKLTSGATPAVASTPTAGYAKSSNRLVVALGISTADVVLNDVWVLANASGLCTAGQPCTLKATASDPDAGDTLTFSLDVAPAGMVIDAANGAIVWTPVVGQIGNQAVTVRATDHGGLFATQTFTATVAPVAVPNLVGLAPDWAESFLTAADLAVGSKTSQGGAITLNFDSLPSRQGWTYFQEGTLAPEEQVFSVGGGSLLQNTIGVGFDAKAGSNAYVFSNTPDKRLPARLALRARVLEAEGLVDANPFGFHFGFVINSVNEYVGVGTDRVTDVTRGFWLIPFNGTAFHDYRLESAATNTWRIIVDEQFVGDLSGYGPYPYPDLISFGDGTGGTNARAEVTALSFTQPRVVGQNPPAGTLVPNRTAVDLTIVDGPATETVPNVIGMSQPAAETAILAANLKVGGITSAPHPTIPAGQVSDQSPLPNIRVPKETPVAIVMSTGPPGPVNVAPVITSTPVLAAVVGQSYAYQVTATDANVGDVLGFSLGTAPAGMTIDPATGLIPWTPGDAQAGQHNVEVRVEDQAGAFAVQNYVLDVAAGPICTAPAAASLVFEKAVTFGGGGDQFGNRIRLSGSRLLVAGTDGGAALLHTADVVTLDPVWSRIMPGTAFFSDVAATANAIYPVGGARPPTCGARDGVGGTEAKSLIARYSSSGDFLSCHSRTFFGYAGYEHYYAATAATVGNVPFIFATGLHQTSGHPSVFVLAKYDETGALVSQAGEPSLAFGLTYADGSLYAVGSRWQGDGRWENHRPVLAKFDLNPTLVWKIEPPEAQAGYFHSVTTLDSSIFAVGYVYEPGVPGSEDYLIEKYDDAGNRLWRRTFGALGTDRLRDIVSVRGRLFAVGSTAQPVGGKTDTVLLEFDPISGDLLATRTFGGSQEDGAEGIVTDGQSLFITGHTRSLGSAAGNSVGQRDVLLLKYRVADASCLPRILSMPPIEAFSGSLYAYDVDAAGATVGDALVYALGSSPAGMAINSATGLITWTPTSDQVGDHHVVIQVSDPAGSLATQSYPINVGLATTDNHPPAVTSTPVTVANTGVSYNYLVVASDPDAGTALTFSLPTAPGGMTINATTGVIDWTPTLAEVGSHPVTVRVTDPGGLFAEQSFNIAVSAPAPTNRAPTITSTAPLAATASTAYSYPVAATDPDANDTLTYSLPSAPSGMTISATTGLIAWTPTLAQLGDHNVTVRVSDTGGLFAEQTFTITVVTPPPINQAPAINSTPLTTATADTRYSYDVDASDPDVGEVLTYSLTTAPAGMSIDAASGLVEWTPSAAQTGDHPVEVKVQDAGGLSATQPFTITVAAVAVCTPPPAALISWWPGEDNALDRAAANDGSAENGPTFAPGLVGQAFRFNGLNDLIRIASSRTTSFGGAFSVEFWFNPTTTIDTGTPNQVLLAKGRYTEGGFNAPVAIQVLGGDGRLLVRMPPAPALVSTTTTWPAGTWQHIALSWDGAHYRLYVNGIEEAGLDNAFSIIDSTDEITLGNADGFAAAGFAGLVDEAALYNRALSAAEVAAVHAARGLGKCTATYSRADAGPDQAVGVATTVTLDGSVSRAFDGAPLSYQWTLATRPASSAAVLSDASAVNPTFVADQAGVYTLELVVNNTGRASAPDSVSITAAQVNHAPTISSTPITAAAIDSAYSYPVIASDPDVGDTLSYSLPIAPAGMSIDAASGLIQWTPVTGQVGSHNVSVRVQDAGGLFALQPFVLVAAAAPVPVSVPNVVGQEQAAAQSVLTAAALGVGAVATASSESVAVGHVISQDPAAGTLVHSDSAVNLVVSSGPPGMSVASIRVTPIAPLILTGQTQAFTATGILSNGSSRPLSSGLVWASSNPAVASIDAAGVATALSEGSTTISVSEGGATGSTVFSVALATADDSTLPVAAITSPADGVGVVAAVPIVGTASDANFLKYVLEIAPFETGTFSTLAVGTTPVTDGTLATLDPTTLVNDLYVLRLTVIDRADNRSQTEITVQLNRDKKVGNFTLAFQDLNVPMAGIPISVVRSYDSRDKSLGDFGIGWRLDVQSLRLRVIGVGGQGWEQIRSGGVLSRRYTISPTRLHKVAITLPDGKVEEFDLTVSPSSQGFVPILVVDAVYSPRALTRGSLRALGDTRLVTFGAVGAIDLLTESGLEVFNPQEFEYTTAEGQVVLISRVDGVRQIRDRSGNTVSFSATGITHSAGKSISFSRDAQNRITSVTDPNGHVQNYSYDINGDLASHTDAEGRSTGFLYNYDHGLIEIRDPRGVRPIRNEYDDAGRLIKTIDAYGKEISYTHDLGANREVITDRLGNATIHVYDDQGNVTQTADALGGVTNRSYDARGNTLSEQDPLGRTRSYTYDGQDNRLTETDPLGKTATYRYNGNRQVLSVIDALGRTTSNTYDAAGNLTSSTDPAGNVTSYSYDSRGLQLTRTDSLGKLSSYAYDASGNLTTETDALNRVTTYTYDANGNRLTQSTTRSTAGGSETLLTSFVYDRDNRLTQTTNPDGSVTRIAYNAIGKQSLTTDQLGRETKYDYDDMGRLIKTTYPDGRSETSAYDAEGRRISSTDRAGRTSASTYDALGRLTASTAPDGTTTSTAYDAAGQVVSSTDARGNATAYSYDAAGRRTQVTDAVGSITTFSYDDAGNQTRVTDANGNAVAFTYDANNRRTRTTYADSTFDQVSYDALGRQVTKTDQAGKTTQFAYDALGRLISVTDALGQITRYTYDELGNQLTQTDAEGRSTSFAYDRMGRRTTRTLPLGQSESMSYDAAGNLRTKADFNGRTTTYAYDTLNRLLSKTPDASLGQPPVVFTYTASGQRASMQDASGSTTYSYDNRDRLLSKATPQGTLNYSYDAAGNLTNIHSNHSGGAAMDYAYDARNRLASVTDANGSTTYSYDAVGNLAGFLYPNGVQTSYTYNTLNRLTNVTGAESGTLASYTYTLGPTGNRTAVTEASGRQVDYSYDDLYRLKSETISADPTGPNGAITYTYDKVGNRLTRSSTVAVIPDQSFAYDFNDRLDGEGYDDNGNTLTSGSRSFGYDFENHLVTANGGVSFVYNGDGIRVAKTAGGVTTGFLVDDRNPTGYAQVLEEIVGGSVAKSYTYGLKLVSQKQASGVSFYGFDGHGSVRYLTDASGGVTDTYFYEGFGNMVGHTGSAASTYLYAGETRDEGVALDYLRARYYDFARGRFLSRDQYEGKEVRPQTFHKYIYGHADPVNNKDPSGLSSLFEISVSIAINQITTKSLLAAYYSRHFAFLRKGSEIVHCELQPQYHRKNFALAAISNGFVDPAVIDTYNDSSEKIIAGLNHLARAARDVYAPDFFDLLTSPLELSRLSTNTTHYDRIVDHGTEWMGNIELRKYWGYAKILSTLGKATLRMYRDMQTLGSNRFEGCRRTRYANYVYDVWSGLSDFIKENGDISADPDWVAQYTYFQFNPGP